MPRTIRIECASNIYHVFNRGVGHQFIFEDDDDRIELLNRVVRLSSSLHVTVLAWVLMNNHVHFLLHASMASISVFMQRLQSAYASYFNERHHHLGHLFQGRFGSQGIESNEQLLAVMRYIHRNPVEAGLSKTLDYAWSSYGEYLGQPRLCKVSFIFNMFDNSVEFEKFHTAVANGHVASPGRREFCSVKPNDKEALQIAEQEFGANWKDLILSQDKEFRNASLRKLKAHGLSIRQIERMTGIGRGIIQRS